MTASLKALDLVQTQQAFITGAVTDALSGGQLRSRPLIELVYRDTPERAFDLDLQQSPEGLFALNGNPRTAFPELDALASINLTLRASADGYQAAGVDISLSSANLALSTAPRLIGGRSLDVTIRINLPIRRDLALAPLPVHLAGRVVSKSEPSQPVAGAQVSITSPDARGPATTNSDGFFGIQSLPVSKVVTVRVAKTGFTTLEQDITLDYRFPVNQQSFAL